MFTLTEYMTFNKLKEDECRYKGKKKKYKVQSMHIYSDSEKKIFF